MAKQKKKLNTFEQLILFAVIGAIVFLVLVELDIFNISGLPTSANVFGDLGIGFVASATTAILFKIGEKKLG